MIFFNEKQNILYLSNASSMARLIEVVDDAYNDEISRTHMWQKTWSETKNLKFPHHYMAIGMGKSNAIFFFNFDPYLTYPTPHTSPQSSLAASLIFFQA